MATSDVYKSVAKQDLENIPMIVYRLRGKDCHSITTIEFKIPNFRKLKDNVHYNKTMGLLKCNIDFFKRQNSVGILFCIADEHVSSVQCYVSYDEMYCRSDTIKMNRMSPFEYEVYLEPEVIYHSRNELIKMGSLQLMFTVRKQISLMAVRPFSGKRPLGEALNPTQLPDRLDTPRRVCEIQKLAADMKNLSHRHIFADFKIRVQNYVLPVHKALMAGRSGFFHEYIRENSKEITLCVKPETLSFVICFIYYGTLMVTELEELLQILELAVELRVSSLVNLIVMHLKFNIDKTDVDLIRNAGSKPGMEILVKLADDYVDADDLYGIEKDEDDETDSGE